MPLNRTDTYTRTVACQVRGLTEEQQKARMKRFASAQAEKARLQLLAQQRDELVCLRERIFVAKRKNFSKQVRDGCCCCCFY